MTTIGHLPPEVLSLICQDYEALTLWKTGDQRLRATLSKGGVHKLTLINVLKADSLPFPSACQSFLGLRELCIDRKGYILASANDLKNAVLSLPPSLTRLHFNFEDATTLFLLTDLPQGSSSEWINRRPVFMAGNAEKRCHDMNTLFPRLETLELIWKNEPYRVFSKSDLAAFPPTLTSLRLPSFDTYEDDVFNALPQSLTRLHLGATRRISPGALSNLPRASLTLLDDHCPALDSLTVDHIKELPPSLTKWPSKGKLTLWTPELASIMPQCFKGSLYIDFLLGTPIESWKECAEPLLKAHHMIGYEPISDAHLSQSALFEPLIITLPACLTHLRLWTYPEAATTCYGSIRASSAYFLALSPPSSSSRLIGTVHKRCRARTGLRGSRRSVSAR